MKVFWSWQSDTPGRVGRHFVRTALEDAISSLKRDVALDEPTREELHVDHDRKGVSGSPDLARVILDKIAESAVFVADVTPVGQTPDDKRLINANVAIELGYALGVVGDTGLLMVMNEAYGTRGHLPFDLRQKAGPITFKLFAHATSAEIEREKKGFAGVLKVALRDCLKNRLLAEQPDAAAAHEEVSPRETCAQYFPLGEVLMERSMLNTSSNELFYDKPAILYLRVIPSKKMLELRKAELADLVFGIKVPPLHTGLGGVPVTAETNTVASLTLLKLMVALPSCSRPLRYFQTMNCGALMRLYLATADRFPAFS